MTDRLKLSPPSRLDRTVASTRSGRTAGIFVLVDVDGVLSVPNRELPDLGHDAWPFERPWATPIPAGREIVRLIGSNPALKPYWHTSWGRDLANQWTQWAGVAPWPAIPTYHYRMPYDPKIDWKLTDAIRFLPRRAPVIWIEDGFAPETERWAHKRGQVSLVDTTGADLWGSAEEILSVWGVPT